MKQTEVQWLKCSRIEEMLRGAGKKMIARKHRLFAIACCRRIWHLLGKKTRKAVETAEAFLEGEISAADLRTCEESLKGRQYQVTAVRHACAPTGKIRSESYWAALCAQLAASQAERPGEVFNLDPGGRKEELEQLPLLRDIFGNPFQPVIADKAWLTPTVKELARVIYDERRFDELPILGDALEDAGADHNEILDHCRSETVHVRGCWVVDLVTEKK